ncbi:hypothetical protein ACFSKW_52160 [Nonomuraea mangrovi]|uniref:Uncharacterized protein n=1 Tax=Nonomuraea mangrovi TaxID=2316207 RepID=A0ABW4TDD3_9ACTN
MVVAAAVVETDAAFVPTTDDDAAARWRAELVKRYRQTIRRRRPWRRHCTTS